MCIIYFIINQSNFANLLKLEIDVQRWISKTLMIKYDKFVCLFVYYLQYFIFMFRLVRNKSVGRKRVVLADKTWMKT